MTKEEKDAFFAQYLGQKVFMVDPKAIVCQTVSPYFLDKNFDNPILSLHSLSEITEEEAIEAAKIFGLSKDNETSDIINFGIEVCLDDRHLADQKTIDYLRSRGFLLPFRQYSISDLLNEGVAKLKD